MGSWGRSTRCVVLAGFCLSLLAPAAARAQVFFVDMAGSGTACTEEAPCQTISQALTTSRAAPGTGDVIQVGPGLFAEKVVINDEEGDAGLTLRGAGRGADQASTPPGATTVRSPETLTGAAIAVDKATGVSIEDMRVEVPAGFANVAGIALGSLLTGAPGVTIRNVHIQSSGDVNTEGIWVGAKSPNVSILDTRIRQLGTYRGIAIFGPRTTVADSDVFAESGQALDTESLGEEVRVLRSRLAVGSGIVGTIRSPEVAIDSSLLVGGSEGIEAFANFGAINVVTLSNDTIDVGQPRIDDGAFAAKARAESEGTAGVTLVNSIALEGQEVAGTASASVTCKSSIVRLQAETSASGPIACDAGGENTFAPPDSLFAGAGDWHLQPGSAAVDSGRFEDTLSASDLDGAPRVVDGNNDGAAVIDRGAYELPTPSALPSTTAPSNVFRFGKLKRNRRRGTARLQVIVPGPGRLALVGRKVRRSTLEATRAGTFALKVVPKAKLGKALASRGKATTSVKVTFTPTGGAGSTRSKKLSLIRRRRR